VGVDYWERQQQAAEEYSEFIRNMTETDMQELVDTAQLIADTFENMFSAGIEGWDEFKEAAVSAIKRMMVQLAAMGALYLALSFIPGFAAFMEAVGKVSGFMNGDFIPGKVATNASGTQQFKIFGKDIATAGNRSMNALISNT
jgi:hypothetical protein